MAELKYEWEDWDKEKAVSGNLVGVKNNDKESDFSLTGRLRPTSVSNVYTLIVQGYKLEVVGEGYISKWSPEPPVGADYDPKLHMAVASMGTTAAIGTSFTRPGTEGEPEEVEVDLSEMEPRDYFAVNAMRAMLAQTIHPETFDDATCLYYAKASYRWAQAMIIAAIQARGEYEDPDETVTISLTIVSNVQSYSTGEIKLYVEGHIGIWANLPDYDPSENVYSFAEGSTRKFTQIKCLGNGVTASKYLGKSFEGDPVVYAFDGTVHNSSMVTCNISGEGGVFKDGGKYTITITAYNPINEQVQE